MNTFTRAAFAVLSLSASLAAGPALAEGEGSGDPYPFAAAATSVSGSPFAAETWAEAQPRSTGRTDHAAMAAELMPSGNEAVVQTAGSLPVRFADGMAAHAQVRRRAPGLGVPVRVVQAAGNGGMQRQ